MKTLLLTALLCAAPLRAAEDPRLAAELCRLSAETCLDAISYEFRKDPDLGPALAALKPEAAAGLCAARPATQAELFDRAAALADTAALPAGSRTAAERALKAARDYIAPEALPALAPAAARPGSAEAPADLRVLPAGPPEVSAADVCSLDWKDPSGYAASRLGPLRAVLDALGPADGIVLTDLPLASLPAQLAGDGRLTELHLPVSGYAKRLWLREGRRTTLLVTDLQGAAFLRHFGLLIKRYYCGRPAPALAAAESPSAYGRYYRALARVAQENPGALAGLSGLISGYAETFRVQWSSYSAASVSDGAGDWRVDVYRLPGAGLWGVVSAHSPYYGEILGENLRYLVETSTGIRAVVLAGSGGSLDPRPLYGVVYPSDVRTSGGGLVPNALGSAADFRPHASVLSPLEETPAWLAGALKDGLSTVDVEMAPAARILAGRGLKLGFAVLVTDYPSRRPVVARLLERASLASQDPSLKYRALRAFADGLREWAAGGPPPGWQPEEKKLGRSLEAQSALNLAAAERALRPLRPGEEELLEKLRKFFASDPPSFSVRMSTSRAAAVLADGDLLSTALVSALKGAPVKPFTPSYEENDYGAYDYIFGTLSYWDGPEKYGPAVLRLSPETWRGRAWATRRSAMRALAVEAEKAGKTPEEAQRDPALVKAADALFASWIVVPRDLPRALAAQVVSELRELPPGAFAAFSEAAAAEIPGLIKKFDVGWLEGKIRGSVRAGEIVLVKVPAPVPAAIAAPAKTLTIPIKPEK